jgi:hypothetical protein
MSSDPAGQPSEPGAGPGNASGQPSEEELRAAYEAELSRITSTDMMLQAAVSLLNIGGHRLRGTGDSQAGGGTPVGAERDLEQVRDAIDAVRALLGILERRLPKELGPLRDALSQLQIAYAREAQAGAGDASSAAPDPQGGEQSAQPGGAGATPQGEGTPSEKKDSPTGEEPPDGPGPAEASGRLWVPGR